MKVRFSKAANIKHNKNHQHQAVMKFPDRKRQRSAITEKDKQWVVKYWKSGNLKS